MPWTHCQRSYYWVSDSYWPSPRSTLSCWLPPRPLPAVSGLVLWTLGSFRPAATSAHISTMPAAYSALLLLLPDTQAPEQTCPYLPPTSDPVKAPPHPQIRWKTRPNKQIPPQPGSCSSLLSPCTSPKWVRRSCPRVKIGNKKLPLAPFHVLFVLPFHSSLLSYLHAWWMKFKVYRKNSMHSRA